MVYQYAELALYVKVLFRVYQREEQVSFVKANAPCRVKEKVVVAKASAPVYLYVQRLTASRAWRPWGTRGIREASAPSCTPVRPVGPQE